MNDFRIYKVSELKKMKPGSVFEHESLGRCIVLRNRQAGYNYMAFKGGFPDAWFYDDGHPWNEPMRLIYVAKA